MPEAPDQLDATKVLIVEDEPPARKLLKLHLGFQTPPLVPEEIDHSEYHSIEELARRMRESPALSAILDGKLPGGKTAVELIKLLQAQDRPWVLVVLSANDDIVTAVRRRFSDIPAYVKNGNYNAVMESLQARIAVVHSTLPASQN